MRFQPGSFLLFGALLAASFLHVRGADFSLREQKVAAPEMGEVLTCVVTQGQKTYSFVPPFGWNTDHDPQRQRVILTSKDRTASITIIWRENDPAGDPAGPEALRHQLLSRYPAGRIEAEFPCYTGSHSGTAFDVAWTGEGDVQMNSRVAILSAGSKAIEFTLTTMVSQFRRIQAELGGLMTSFREDSPRG